MDIRLSEKEALRRAIEAHREGRLKEAEVYYSAILAANSANPDANHNMGILLYSLKKFDNCLDFFHVALNSDPSVDQYWISYLGALIAIQDYEKASALISACDREGLKLILQQKLDEDFRDFKNREELGDFEKATKEIIALIQSSKYTSALSHLDGLVAYSNKEKGYRSNLVGLAKLGQGDYLSSVDYFSDAISQNPSFSEAYLNCGLAYEALGKSSQSLMYFKKAASLKPRWVMAHKKAIFSLLQLKDYSAANEYILSVWQDSPSEPEYQYLRGLYFYKVNKFKEASDLLQQLVDINPEHTEAHGTLALAKVQLGDHSSAHKSFINALKLSPSDYSILKNFGIFLFQRGRTKEALKVFQSCTKIKSQDSEVVGNIGSCLLRENNVEEAIIYLQKAINLNQQSVTFLNNLAIAHERCGDFNSASKYFKKALGQAPSSGEAYLGLSRIYKFVSKEDISIAGLDHLIDDQSISTLDRSKIAFGSFAYLEAEGKLEESFKVLKIANSLRRRSLNYDHANDLAVFDMIYKRDGILRGFQKKVPHIERTQEPIFIVGMPRSGTTLVEQILSCHSSVTAGGELPTVGLFFNVHLKPEPDSSPWDLAFSLAKHYSQTELSDAGRGSKYVTDKMPQNFLYLNLIFEAFPKAKVLHVQRSPEAVCWSNYKTFFSSDIGYCYDLKDTISYYRQYRKLMEHWNNRFGGKIFSLNYDDLVSDPKAQVGALLNYLDLPFEAACLAPEANDRIVSTASNYQIREPIYRRSSEAWRKFESFLGSDLPLLQSLSS